MECTPDFKMSPGCKIDDDFRITEDLPYIEWTVKNYKKLLMNHTTLESPRFMLKGAKWNLRLFNSGGNELSAFLNLVDFPRPKDYHITYLMTIHINEDNIRGSSKKDYFFDTASYGFWYSDILGKSSPSDSLTFFCMFFPEVQQTSESDARRCENSLNISHEVSSETTENTTATVSSLLKVERSQDIFSIKFGLLCIEWNIKNFKSLLKRNRLVFMKSPSFPMRGASWDISLHYKGKDLFLLLHRSKCESERQRHSITYLILIHINNIEICGGFLKTVLFDETKSFVCGGSVSLDLWSERYRSDNLRVFCIIFPEVQGAPEVSESHAKGVEKHSKTSHEGIDILVSNMKDLFINEENCDFVIKVKGRDFHVHRAILAARSPVLSAMLQHDMAEKNSGSIDIVDCEPDVFERFLLYLYSGRVKELSWSYVTHLYTLGDKYDLPHLRKECLRFMERNLSIEAFCDAIALAVKHKEKTLVTCAEEFFLKNVKSILVTNKWQLLMNENPVICNELFLKFTTKFTSTN